MAAAAPAFQRVRTGDGRVVQRVAAGWTWPGLPPNAHAALPAVDDALADDVQQFVPLDPPVANAADLEAHNHFVHAFRTQYTDIVPLKLSHLVFLRDLQAAMDPLPWLESPPPPAADVVGPRCRRVHRRHRALRHAYNAYHVAGRRRAYDHDTDAGLFPPEEILSWTAVRRLVQARRRVRGGDGHPPPSVRRFRESDDLHATHYVPNNAAAGVPINAFPWRPDLPDVDDTLAQYYEHDVLQHIERVNVASHLGSLVHQRLLVRFGTGLHGDDDGVDPGPAAHATFLYKAQRDVHGRRGLVRKLGNLGNRVRLSHGPERILGPGDAGRYVALNGDHYRQGPDTQPAFQPVFSEVTGGDGAGGPTVLVPRLVLDHLRKASVEYVTENDAPLVPALADAVVNALHRHSLDVVAVEPWVYDPFRLFYTDEGADLYDARFFWTRADFVARNRTTGALVVGELKNKFGATTQTDVLNDGAPVQQVLVNALLFSLVYRVRVDAVCVVYANRARHVVVATHPFALANAAAPWNAYVRSTLEA